MTRLAVGGGPRGATGGPASGHRRAPRQPGARSCPRPNYLHPAGLARLDVPTTPTKARPRHAPAVVRLKQRILIVDDEPDILASLGTGLQRFLGLPCDVEEARDGEAARRMLDSPGGRPYDMVISDERMPGLRGVELLEWLRLTSPRTVRVLMTAFRDPNLAPDAVNRAGAHLLLYKPFSFDEALPLLREALLGKARRDEHEKALDRALRAFRRLAGGTGH